MQDSGLIKIDVSRIIPADKWKVIRLLTKVWEFPTYIPCVKEVSVIHKTHNKMTTRWRIEINKVPIRWTEEDDLLLKQDTICFKATEGDFAVFKGEWKFENHPEGTKVCVNVYLKIEIPTIKEFAQEYVKKLVIMNFEAILRAVETRVISMRYAPQKDGGNEKVAGFGVIGHFYNFNHLTKCLKMLNPDFKMPSREFLARLFHITPSFKLYDTKNFRSKTGQLVNGCFILATFIPEMIERDMWAIFSKVVKACKIAEKHGVGIVTLGGFTSIVGERIGQQIANEVDVAVTTGNTFTAAMAIDGVLKAASLLSLDIANAKVAIIGGTGDIGSGCARVLAHKVKQLTITGRTKSNLRNLRRELAKKRKAKIIATTDNQTAVKDADIIIAAASASASILKIDWFKAGSIICDVGYPKNISYASTTRNDILIFSGGLANTPTPISSPIDTGLPSSDTIYGCFAEAIILALEKRYENLSFVRGNITPEKIDEIRKMGQKHGFSVSEFWCGDKLVDELVLERIKQTIDAKELQKE